MKVENMTGRTGRAVANQFIITTDAGRYFQSYGSIIVFIPNATDWADRPKGCDVAPKTQLDHHKWDYSTTTGKYRNFFLGETKRETEAKIKSGEYALAELNN